MNVDLYGIPNCDTVRRARRWLREAGVAHTFHDYRREGVDAALLAHAADLLGWEALLNRRGTTWRRLAPSERAAAADRGGALELMVRQPTLIKRPLLLVDGRPRAVGFDPERYRALLGV
ncbi:MAG: ArsC family reductase [Zetaproteobacteria bacterium]|nr:MAG: ArsC family reductase [Zetaproteobacteria bacterium]